MIDRFYHFIKELYNFITVMWSYPLIQNKILDIRLGKFLLATLIILLGRRIARYLAVKINLLFIVRFIKDKKTRTWLESTIGTFLSVALVLVALLLMGFSSSAFAKTWRLTIFSIKGSDIELGNIIIGFILLILGLGLTNYLSRQIVMLIPRRFQEDISVKKSLETIFKYILFVFVLLFVLSVVGIPLTAFTVIGGGFAIGFGLGSQHLVNNFLSGLVLMMERPLKVGDIVEMENHRGTVEHIGGRSTRIRTFENYRLVMPNSKLLENTVVNWSLVDNFLRREINVGVAYGSPVWKVHDLILKAVKDHPAIENQPEPIVLFTDFGNSALMFKTYFWIQLSEEINPLIVESDVRFRIDELFRDTGIVIAFPQLDIHLDAQDPMVIKIIDSQKVETNKTDRK
jgi:small-conductance mechanosensitive channel